MPKITFFLTADENTTFDPELISALKTSDENTDLSPLYDKYGQNVVLEAMFSIDDNPHRDSQWLYLGVDQIEDWLWEEFYDNCFPYIEGAFLERHNPERPLLINAAK